MSHWLSVVSSFHSTDDYLTRTLPEERWIVKHLIPAGGLVTLYGKPKCGKSFFALGLAASVSDGHPWFLMPEFTVDVPGPVVFLQLDTPPSIWTEYIEGVVGGGMNLNRCIGPTVWMSRMARLIS